jgi:hypothetical protein
MEGSSRRLKEVTAELKEVEKGTPRWYALIDEERFINKNLLLEEKIATVNHNLANQRAVRSNACSQLLVLGRSTVKDEHISEGISSAKHDIEASVYKTVDLENTLKELRLERDELFSQRTESRALEATFTIQHTGR